MILKKTEIEIANPSFGATGKCQQNLCNCLKCKFCSFVIFLSVSDTDTFEMVNSVRSPPKEIFWENVAFVQFIIEHILFSNVIWCNKTDS